MVKRTEDSQRKVIENLLLKGDDTLRGEIKLLKQERKEQLKKFQERERRIKKREERLELEERQIADFRRNAQPILDLLSDVGKRREASCMSAFQSILETLREVGNRDDADIRVTCARREGRLRYISPEERKLGHTLTILMMAMKGVD